MRVLRRASVLIPCVTSLFIGAFPLLGQVPQASTATFEITSVKPSPPGVSHGYIRRMSIGIFSTVAMTVREVIALCFYVRPYQILGGPDWTAEERFDIIGKDPAPGANTPKKPDEKALSAAIGTDFQQFRGLLAERFALKLHQETRVMSGFVLVAGKKAKFVATPCPSSGYRVQHGWVEGDIHMTSLAAELKTDLGVPVEDRTGLPDCYHIKAQWTTDPDNDSLPQIPTALHDLGLRIQRAKLNVDVLVIDHIERPQPD
jgi:uncharacterized protein (TIGR03435 family)